MEVKLMSKRTLPEIHHKISSGASAVSYKTKDGRTLKRYYNNDVYKKILSTHNGDFLGFLREVDKLDNPLFVELDEIFLGVNRLVGAMTYDYQGGTTINEMYPKTDLIRLRDALIDADERLRKLENFKLRDIHYRNIMYTGDIKILDTDFCIFTDSDQTKHNVSHVNEFIIRGLFNLDLHTRIQVDDRLRNVYKAAMKGDAAAYEFLIEYMKLEKEDKGVCKYYKHLSKDFIGERHGLFGSIKH